MESKSARERILLVGSRLSATIQRKQQALANIAEVTRARGDFETFPLQRNRAVAAALSKTLQRRPETEH